MVVEAAAGPPPNYVMRLAYNALVARLLAGARGDDDGNGRAHEPQDDRHLAERRFRAGRLYGLAELLIV